MAGIPRQADAVVIGGGAVGLSCAYVLAGSGIRVLVLERDHVGAGASAGTACMICPSHADRTASPASLRSGLRFLLDPKAPLKLRPRPSELGWVARFTSASLRDAEAEAGTRLLRRLAVRSTDLHRAWADELGTGLAMNGTLNLWGGADAAGGPGRPPWSRRRVTPGSRSRRSTRPGSRRSSHPSAAPRTARSRPATATSIRCS
ncbi:MAG: FAD-dependent oxidoreductase [Gaiellales bacterium]